MSEELEQQFREAQQRINNYIDELWKEYHKKSFIECYEELGCIILSNDDTFYRNTDLFPSYRIRKAGITPITTQPQFLVSA